MPLYSFICAQQHLCEKLLTIAERTQPGPCPDCGDPLERIYLSRSQSAQRFDPIALDVAPDGTYSFPMRSDAPIPAGYQRRELRTFQEADAVLRQVNASERRKVEQRIEVEHMNLADAEARNHSDLRSRMGTMSRAGRDFARLAMHVAEQRRPRSFDPSVFLEVRERDSSNRDGHEDARTGWRTRRS